MHYLSEQHILLFLVQVFILLLLTRGLGELFRQRNQPPLTAELLVGVILGPTVLGRCAPSVHGMLFPTDLVQQTMLETVSWIGVLFLLLATGLEIDFSIAWRQRGSALVIALSDIVIPMALAFIPALLLPAKYLVDVDQRLIFACFMATAMTISAMPVSARILHDFDILRADLGLLIMSALAVNDTLGWVVFTIVLGLFTQATHTAGSVLVILAGTIGVCVAALTFGRRLSTAVLGTLQRRGFPEPGTSLTFACILGLFLGALTQGLGIHALFGFFIAGIVMGESRALSQETRITIEQMVHAIFVPLFFANIGLKIDFAANFDLGLVLLVTSIGIAGRYAGAWIGATLARVRRRDRDVISIAHTPGGMMEIVVALLALETGLITAPVFVAIALGALGSSVILGPWMHRALKRRAPVCVADYIHPASVVAHVRAATRLGVIEELLAKAGDRLGDAARASVLAAMAHREADFSTALAHGLAVPHVRVEGLREPVLMFGRSVGGIDWDAPDGHPTHYVFLIVSPADLNDVHLQLLAAIAKGMRKSETRAAIDAAMDEQALWKGLSEGFCTA
ncbi:cation:proton antiporter [Candidatus Fermentibacteria bacterium]|nr:cation:proton antiporter [Candidatus Fermentibacteria bacterium]